MRVPAAGLAPGAVISGGSLAGWWTVTAARPVEPDGVELIVVGLDDGTAREVRFQPGECVHRADPSSVHHRDEVVGMTVEHARVWAAALGWQFENRSIAGMLFTDDQRGRRISVWADAVGVVVRAELS